MTFFSPIVRGDQQPFKGSRFHHPKKGHQQNCQGVEVLVFCRVLRRLVLRNEACLAKKSFVQTGSFKTKNGSPPSELGYSFEFLNFLGGATPETMVFLGCFYWFFVHDFSPVFVRSSADISEEHPTSSQAPTVGGFLWTSA